MNTTRFLLSALSAGFAAGSLFAAYPGAKSNVTLTVTATSEHGGFLIKNSVIEAQTENSPVRYYNQLNPLGYEPAVKNPANYYVGKEFTKFKTFGSGEDALTLITERVVDEVVKLKTQKFSNAHFIEELIARELVPITSGRGYKLVLVQPADRAESDGDQVMLFFIENGSSIYYVGREAYENLTSRDALVLGFEDVYSESYNYRKRTVFKHTTGDEGVDRDEEGVTTISETFKGTDLVHFGIFAGYYDAALEQYISTDGLSFEFAGHLNYNGRYDAANDQYLISSATLLNIPGVFEEEYEGEGEGDDSYTSGVATLSMSVAGSQVLADITPYLNALPTELAALKQRIIDSYSESDEEIVEETVE